jgi:hypothetical protein
LEKYDIFSLYLSIFLIQLSNGVIRYDLVRPAPAGGGVMVVTASATLTSSVVADTRWHRIAMEVAPDGAMVFHFLYHS